MPENHTAMFRNDAVASLFNFGVHLMAPETPRKTYGSNPFAAIRKVADPMLVSKKSPRTPKILNATGSTSNLNLGGAGNGSLSSVRTPLSPGTFASTSKGLASVALGSGRSGDIGENTTKKAARARTAAPTRVDFLASPSCSPSPTPLGHQRKPRRESDATRPGEVTEELTMPHGRRYTHRIDVPLKEEKDKADLPDHSEDDEGSPPFRLPSRHKSHHHVLHISSSSRPSASSASAGVYSGPTPHRDLSIRSRRLDKLGPAHLFVGELAGNSTEPAKTAVKPRRPYAPSWSKSLQAIERQEQQRQKAYAPMTATAQTNRSRKDEGTRVGLDSTQQRQEAQRSGDSRSAVPPPLPSRTSTGTATSAPASNLVPVAQPETDPGPLPVAGNVSVSAVHTSDRDLSSDGDSIPPISPNPEPQTRSNNHPESQAPPALKSLTPAQAPNDPSDDDHPQPFPKKTRREPADFPLPASLPPIEVDYSKYEIPDLSDTDDENDPDMIFPELTQLLNAAKGVSGKEKEKKDVKGKGRAKEEEEEQGEKMDVDQASGDEEEGVDQLFSEDRDDPNLGDGIGVGDAQKGADDRMDYETDPDDMYIQDTLISPSESRSPDHPPRIDDIRKKNVKKREREYDLVEPSPAPPASKRVKVTSNSASTSAAVISSTQQPKPQPRSKPRSTGSMAPPPSTVPPTFAESSISNASSNSSTNSNPNNQSSSLIAANYTKHPEFWQLDGSLQVQIRNVRFKLTRSRMVRISGLFKDVIDSVSSKARGKRRMGGVRVSWEGTMPVVTLDEEKVVSASDFEVWVRAVEDTFSYLASGPSLTSIYALQRASTALRSPSPLAHATKVVSDVWSGDLKKLTTTKLSGATEVLALSRKSGGIGGTMDGVVKRAMYELLRHETFEQEDSDSDEDDCEIFSVHGSSEEEDEVYPKNRSSKGGRHGDNRKKWKLPTKDVMLLTSARAKLQRRWMKDTAVYPGELLPCQGLSSSPTTSSTTSTSSGQLPPRAPSACPGTNPPLAQEVFRKLLLSAPSSAAESNLNDEDTIDHVEAYMDDVVCGYTALLSLPWRERAGFCDDCVERQRRMWSGTRERVWKDCEVLFGLRK